MCTVILKWYDSNVIFNLYFHFNSYLKDYVGVVRRTVFVWTIVHTCVSCVCTTVRTYTLCAVLYTCFIYFLIICIYI